MLEIGLGVLLFTAIVTGLAVAILVVRTRLIVAGQARIVVNDDRSVTAVTGTTLLEALNRARINLPSACGGMGTCGQCRVTVRQGGGPVRPVERSRLSRREIAQGVRLACQVAVRSDLAVEVADEIFGAKEYRCSVRSNRNVASLIKELVLDLPAGETMPFRAGAYVQVTCPPHRTRFAEFDIAEPFRDEWDRLDLWRLEGGSRLATTRAYSLANYPDEGPRVMLNVRIALPPPGATDSVPPGIVSSYLFGLDPGDDVTITGPYGHFFARESDAEMVFVGGGAGMAPLRALIFDQLKRLKTHRRLSFWYGARSRRELFYDGEFTRLADAHENFRFEAALSEPRPGDGWTGATGFIHEVLYEKYLKDHPAPETCEYYLCGPPLMIRAVRAMLDGLGVDDDCIFFDDFGA